MAAIDLISARRDSVIQSYNSAKAINLLRFLEGDDKATADYIFPNQITDATNVVHSFYKHKRRVISIQKKTKVGADGLMIEIAKLLTTHIDDDFVVNPANVRIITGMNNAGWEKDMINKAPDCFKDKIFHHGKLSRSDLENINNSLIIIDEIDSGDKERQVLHKTLEKAGILDVNHMENNNNMFVFISATMIKELYDLYQWGDLHEFYKMTIPPSYFGHKDFLEKGILKEFYPLNSKEDAEKWVKEDIINHYEDDYRVHIVRLTTNGKIKNVDFVRNACISMGVSFRNHTSHKDEKLLEEEINEIFKNTTNRHIVLGVKGFYRRANLIPNSWKLRIGATHELYTTTVDYNVQIQGLPGRMTGYWRDDIEGGHKTGPHRTSLKAIEEYEKIYDDPFGLNSYQTAGFKKIKGKVRANPTMLSSKNILNLNPTNLPIVEDKTNPATIPIIIDITPNEYDNMKKIKGKEWDYSTINFIIKKYRPDITTKLEEIEKSGGKDQIVQPNKGATTYSVYITDFVNASNINKPHHHVGNIKDKKKDTFQIYLDKIEHRVIVSIYYGSKIITT